MCKGGGFQEILITCQEGDTAEEDDAWDWCRHASSVADGQLQAVPPQKGSRKTGDIHARKWGLHEGLIFKQLQHIYLLRIVNCDLQRLDLSAFQDKGWRIYKTQHEVTT